jgi:hypothetical protein
VRILKIAATLLLAGLLPATAGVITFDPYPDNSSAILSGTASVEGYDFTSAHFHIVGVPNTCCVSDGTKYLGADAPQLAFPVTMTKTGGGAFNVLGLDAAKLFLDIGGIPGFPNAASLELLGNVSGGGTVTASLLLPPEGSFGTYSIAGFTNLDSMVISGLLPGVTDNASWGVDNIVVGSGVPEPGTFGLAALAFAALGLAARRLRR